MFEWKYAHTQHGVETAFAAVPGGYLVRTVAWDRQGRGPEYQQHPVGASTAMVFVAHDAPEAAINALLEIPT
jgi:hypothetical protein